MKKILLYLLIALISIIVFVFVYIKIFERQAQQISQGTPIETYNSNKSALVVIDIQEIETGKYSAKEYYTNISDSLIGKVNLVIDTLNKLDVPIIYVKSEISDWFINMLNNSYAKGSKSAEFDQRLTVVSDYIIPKGKEDAFSNPLLDSILIKNKINHLLICGLDAAGCINSTIIAAKNRDYKISVISDAVISKTDSLKNKKLADFVEMGILLTNTSDMLNAINR